MSDSSAPADLLQHAAFVRRLARSLLRDPHAAADVEQETWRASLERPPRSADPRGWLARVVRNFAQRRRRAEGRRSAREECVARPEAEPSAEAALERTETLQRVVDAVRGLEEPYRATILARYYEDLAPRAIAARDGVPLETVHTRLKRGLARLRERLERRDAGWRGTLGLLAGQSPCLPPHAGELTAGVLAHAKVAVLAALGVSVVLWLWDAVGAEEPGSAPLARAPVSAAVAPATPPTDPTRSTREQAPRTPVVVPEVSGRVRDESGAPVPEARVHVLGEADPFGADHPAPSIGWNAWRGRTFACDAEGRWRALLPEPTRVLVVVETSEALERVDGWAEERWVAAPAEGVDFVLRRLPTATLEVRVLEGATRRALADFRVFVYGQRTDLPEGGVQWTGGYYGRQSADGLVRMVLGVPDGKARHLNVGLSEPDVRGLWARLGPGDEAYPEQAVTLVPGGREEVVFVLPERGRLRGQVVDAHGAPLPEAFVFFGPRARATGDEPFRVPRPARVLDGVRTDSAGWFELRGEGAEVSVLHAEHSGATVPVARAGRIALAPRGVLGGRLLDAEGRPLPEVLLHLDGDGTRETAGRATTDAAGAFRFEAVEAGAHALWHDTGGGDVELVAGVRLDPGEEAEVELRLAAGPAPELEVLGLAADELAELDGVLVGLDALFGLQFLGGGRLQGPVPPGRHALATRAGWIGPVDVPAGAARLTVALGAAELRLTSARATSVQLVPAEADAFLRLLAARVRVPVLPGTPLALRAAPGRYVLVGEAGAILRTLELPPEGLTLALD